VFTRTPAAPWLASVGLAPNMFAEPAWLLLAWAGLAATLGAAFVGAAPGISTLMPADADTPPAPRRVRTVLVAALFGVLVYPLIYGTAFELLARADLGIGAGFGTVHGMTALAIRAVRSRPTASPTIVRLLLGRLIYGSLLGLLYVVPVPVAP
jgi:hypothetical protein